MSYSLPISRVVESIASKSPGVIISIFAIGHALNADSRIGEAGTGLKLVLATLGVFRVSVAGAAVGLAQAALEEEGVGSGLDRLFDVARD